MGRNRHNVYLSDATLASLDRHRSRSRRIADLVERHEELVRRTRIRARFTAEEWATLLMACAAWPNSTAAIFGGAAVDVQAWGDAVHQPVDELVYKLRGLSPGEEVALAYALEQERSRADRNAS